jgi:gliding motility-associated-like protein
LTITDPSPVCSPQTVDITSSSVITTTGTSLTYWSDAEATNSITNQTAITASGTYYIKSANATCSIVKPVVVTVNITPTLTVTNPEPVCSPTKVDLTITAVVSPSGTTITYWSDNTATTQILTPTEISASGTYYIKSDDGKCSIIKPVVVAIGNPSAPTTLDATQTFCASNKPLVSDLQTNSGTNIKWYNKDPGGVALNPSVELENGIYYATQTETASGCESTSRLSVTVVLTNPAKPTTSNSTQLFCASKSPKISDLTTDPSGTIKWYSQSVPNGSPFASTDALTDNTHYYATQTTGTPACESTSTLDVLVKITADPVAPTGSSAQLFCATNSPKVSDLKTSTGTNIKWYDVANAGVALNPTDAITDGSHYFATQTTTVLPGCESTSRFEVTVTVTTSPLTPTGDSQQTFCSIPDPKVSDLKTTSGSSILWYESSSGGTPLASTISLVNHEDYYATESGCESATRLKVEVLINTTPLAPTTTKSSQSYCSIDSIKVKDLIATVDNLAIIKWYDQPTVGSTALDPLTILKNGTYYATQTVLGCESSTRLDVVVTIGDPAAPTASSNTQSFCSIDTKKVSDLSATGTALTWYNAPTLGTAYSNTDVLVSGIYYSTQTVDGCESATRLHINVSISDPASPTTTDLSQSFCSIEIKKVSDLSATGTALTWYNDATSVTAYASNAILVSGKYYATQTVGSCESDERLKVEVTVNDPAAPITTDATQSFCSINTKKVSDLSATGTLLTWYNALTLGTAYSNTDVLVSGTYYATQKVGLCESDERLKVEVTVNDPAAPTTTDATQSFCSIDTKKVSDLSATILPGATISWYNPVISGSSTLNPATALVSGTYYATQTVGSCESDSRLKVDVTVNDPLAPTTTNSSQTFCFIDHKKVSDLSATGTSLTWYDSPTLGTAYSNTASLVNGTYYATQKVGLCESKNRLAVVVKISDPSVPTVNKVINPTCLNNYGSIEFSNLPSSGNWTLIATPTVGSVINTSSVGQNFTMTGLIPSSEYKFTVKDNSSNCSSDQTVAITIGSSLIPSIAPTGDFKQYFCLSSSPKISDLVANGTMINWYDAINGGTAFLPTDALTDKAHYFATQTKNGECESSLRLEVTVNLSNLSLAIDTQVKAHCGKSDGIITVKAKDGIGTYDYSWDNQQNKSNVLSNIGVGQYVANVKDSVGCTSTVSIEELCESKIPQVITANGNGKNDTWVLNLEAKSNLKIFNRWGSLVYSASPYMDDWNGQTNEGISIGKGFLPSGTYFYTIDKKDGEKPVSGFIELIR